MWMSFIRYVDVIYVDVIYVDVIYPVCGCHLCGCNLCGCHLPGMWMSFMWVSFMWMSFMWVSGSLLIHPLPSTIIIIAILVFYQSDGNFDTNAPFTPSLLIQSETGFTHMRAFTLQHLIRINDLIQIKLNHLKEVVSHRFSLLWVLIGSVDATRTRTK